MVEDQEQENWITFEDGAVISKRNWKLRNLSKIALSLAIFSVPFIAISYVVVISADGLTEFLAAVGLGALFYVSFRCSRFIGNLLFFKFLNDFLIHYKNDWRPEGVNRNET